MEKDIRWLKRFQNFSRAIRLLQEIQDLNLETLSLLEKEGIVQRFEFTLELAWKTLKDKMEYDGLIIDMISPKMVLKEAYKTKYIDEVEEWIHMVNDRNILSHIYDSIILDKILPDIQSKYTTLLSKLYISLLDTTNE